jgi:hypothetical protein
MSLRDGSDSEQKPKDDAERPARAVVKMHNVRDPRDDQGKPAEEAHSAEEPHDETANEHHGFIAAVHPGTFFVSGHVIGPIGRPRRCLKNHDEQCLASAPRTTRVMRLANALERSEYVQGRFRRRAPVFGNVT